MDANRTRFHLLLGPDDWGRVQIEVPASPPAADTVTARDAWNASPPRDVPLAYDSTTSELVLRSRVFRFVPATGETLSPRDRRGAATDRFGNWYWIDTDGQSIRVESIGSGNTSVYWPTAEAVQTGSRGGFGPLVPATPPAPPRLGGLTVTDDHYLVAGTLDPPGILIFDLHSVGGPRRLRWPAHVPFRPFDMAPMPGGGVFILDRDPDRNHDLLVDAADDELQNAADRYWVLDREFNVCAADQQLDIIAPAAKDPFAPLDGKPGRTIPAEQYPRGISLAAAAALPGLNAIAIESLPDGTVLILDRGAAGATQGRILRFRGAKALGAPLPLDLTPILAHGGPPVSLRGHDLAFVPAAAGAVSAGRLLVASEGGKQTFAFDLFLDGDAWRIEPASDYFPMRLFGGKALVGTPAGAYYDFEDGFIPLVPQSRPVFDPEAALVTPIFDGRDPDCQWHRLALDACIPAGTSVGVETRSANTTADLLTSPWQSEPPLALRRDGSELPFVQQARGLDRGTFELLFQRGRGRYMQLRLTIVGTGTASPRIRALRAWYPRFSYRDHYLPGVYRQEPVAASFIERFLANPEGFFTAIEDRIAAVQKLFDVRSAPAEALDWLASWFGVALDPAWDEPRRRLFITHAIQFWNERGTERGLRRALELATLPCPDPRIFGDDEGWHARCGIRIIETFRKRGTPAVVLGDPTDRSGIRQVVKAEKWTPDAGAGDLLNGYLAILKAAEIEPLPAAFPTTSPADTETAAIWRDYCSRRLGLIPYYQNTPAELARWEAYLATAAPRGTPPPPAADVVRWQAFLARRYQRISALNESWHRTHGAFPDIALPTALPSLQAQQKDWLDFIALPQAMRQRAHHFTVLLPLRAGADEALDPRLREARRERARRIVELEKPAHTNFDVNFYHAMFIVGEARLGYDTVIDAGGRSPDLVSRLVLGQGYLASGTLGARSPQAATDRNVLGRDPLKS